MAQLLSASLLAIDALNDRIITLQHLGKGKQIGHTYLFDLQNPQEVVDTWRFEILPQLEEYYFGQFDAMERELFSSVTHPVFDADTQQIMDFDAKRLYHALCDLIELAESDRPAYASSTTGKIRTDDETDT
jgi:5-methylcytosine-specific restriction protein B